MARDQGRGQLANVHIPRPLSEEKTFDTLILPLLFLLPPTRLSAFCIEKEPRAMARKPCAPAVVCSIATVDDFQNLQSIQRFSLELTTLLAETTC
ncbi:hypothetical protein DPX16_15497 [Anabarilius grahami]|uniref:Uncharacterized protein n=1 Tax=Anabarilius grahami TaxID=495550 RepID=A0A3N0XCF6_ANAGA|nr:hypothetical protein DPX16_15497 [Anabarilius grahami]